jgi:SAM-dependent methyltransferase
LTIWSIIVNITYQRDLRPINGMYKGRGRNYLSLMACPVDHAPLHQDEHGVRCVSHPDHFYPFRSGVLQLVPAPQRDAIDALSAAHDAACDAQGWHSPDEAEFKSLPQNALPGYPEDHWAQQTASTALLWRFLETIRLDQGISPIAPVGEAAVIGAGMGWLAYSLDVAGYTTLAVDARVGARHGLGVFPIARYLRVQADLDHLPLAPAAFDWLIFQEGLAPQCADPDHADQQTALEAALRHLRPDGYIAVIDTPSLEQNAIILSLFDQAGLVPVEPTRWRSWRDRLLGLRDRLKNREPDVPAVLVAQKPR